MHAAESRANPSVLFDKRDPAFKIARSEQDVIEQRGDLGDLWPSRPSARRDEGARSDLEKRAARNVLHFLLLLFRFPVVSKITLSSVECGAGTYPVVTCLGSSGLVRPNVGAAALVLDFRRIGIALEGVFDGEAGKAEVALHFFPAIENEIQRHWMAPAVFLAKNIHADMKRKEEQAARLEDPEHFTKCLENIGLRNVHDGVESHNGGPGAVFDVERQHVALAEFNGCVQFARLFEHSRRKIDAQGIHASLMQVARDVPGATA